MESAFSTSSCFTSPSLINRAPILNGGCVSVAFFESGGCVFFWFLSIEKPSGYFRMRENDVVSQNVFSNIHTRFEGQPSKLYSYKHVL